MNRGGKICSGREVPALNRRILRSVDLDPGVVPALFAVFAKVTGAHSALEKSNDFIEHCFLLSLRRLTPCGLGLPVFASYTGNTYKKIIFIFLHLKSITY
jgi:hypothetical protein